MKKKNLMDGINNIDDDLINEAENPVRKNSGRFKIGISLAGAAAAACVCVAVVQMNSPSPSGMGGSAAADASGLNADNTNPLAASERESDAVPANDEKSKTESMFMPASDYNEVYDRLVETAVSYDIYGGDYVYEDYGPLYVEEAASGAKVAAPSSDAGSDHSTTNIMVEGVDESDTVMTDGNYLYAVYYSEIKIADISEGVPKDSYVLKPEELSADSSIKEIYVDGDRLIIISGGYGYPDYDTSEDDDYYYYRSYGKEYTDMLVYDISDPLSPEYIDKFTQTGWYQTSRKIDDQIYLVTEEYASLPDIDAKEALKKENLKYWLPAVNSEAVPADHIYLGTPDYYGLHGTLISSFNVNKPSACTDSKYFLGDSFEIYVSRSAAYLYSTDYGYIEDFTRLEKLSLDKGKLSLSASATVLGYVNDKFALSESDGYLRILTTNSDASSLFILDKDLKTAGRLDNIAPGEVVYSARYAGDIVYFVTYRNMDPLFCVDLSDPEDPKLLGELELPGYSDYLHLWDKDHLLGIGYDYDESGYLHGMKLAMFDIKDPADPKLEDSFSLTDVDRIDGMEDYKLLLIEPQKNLIGFSGYYYDSYDSGYCYYVFNYDDSFRERMEIRSRSADYRGLFAGDCFYAVYRTDIRTFDMSDNFEELLADDGKDGVRVYR